ncbi:hypothetical protein BDA99DRAFT_566788 [Phascolomyces articulosus]|uniref:Tc1-like transposase DDE domain-containing protein n=1 Tax=Phascolomyces articulosus TaxID=60185 RepID=A0AAD5P6S5_9FUNG|nr:hypothetical protein BDA99DRAFT_566788 [Phascolomyces articulosus]
MRSLRINNEDKLPVHEEDLDAESANFQVSFSVDQDRLNQPGDIINDDTDDEGSDSSDSEDDSEDESTLCSIAPNFLTIGSTAAAEQVNKKKHSTKIVKNPRGRYTNYESDLLRQRAGELLGSGWSFSNIETDMKVPKSTMVNHYKQYKIRKGFAAPKRQKAPRLSKITKDSSNFLVQTVLEKENTATLLQLVHAYFLRFQIVLSPSTIWRHLVRKCDVTIKRAHLYPELRTDDDTKNMRIVDVCVKTTKGGTRTQDFVAFLERVMDKLDEQELAHKNWNIIYDNALIHTATHIGERVIERVDIPVESINKAKEKESEGEPSKKIEKETAEDMASKEVEKRLTNAMCAVTKNDYEKWIMHSTQFFDRCLALEDNL